MAGRVVPRSEFPASVYPNADGDRDINYYKYTIKIKCHMKRTSWIF